MSLHSLPKKDQILYLKSIITNMKYLHHAKAYSNVEVLFKLFDEVWDGPQDDPECDELSAYIACFYYLSKYQSLISGNATADSAALLELDNTVARDRYMKQVTTTVTEVPKQSEQEHVATIINTDGAPLNAINTFIYLIKRKRIELSIDLLINECLKNIDECNRNTNQDNFAECQQKIIAITSRIPISFTKYAEINSDIHSHPLFNELLAKLASGYTHSLRFELRSKSTVSEKYSVFENLRTAVKTAKLYQTNTDLIESEFTQTSKQLKNDIDEYLNQLEQTDYSNCTEETAKKIKLQLNVILPILLDETFYFEGEADKKNEVFLRCFNEIKRLLASNPLNSNVIDAVKSMQKVLRIVHVSAPITCIPKEEVEKLLLRVECAEILSLQEDKDSLLKIEAIKLKLKERREALIGNAPTDNGNDDLKEYWLNAAAKLNPNSQAMFGLINYYFACYYHLMIGHFKGLDKRKERDILVTKAILHFETAESIRMAYSVDHQDSFQDDSVLLTTCKKNHFDHLSYNISHLIKLIKTELAKADKLLEHEEYVSAGDAYKSCWELLNAHPELIINHSVTPPKRILLNAAQAYQSAHENAKTWSCYHLLLKSTDLSLAELFEIRSFLTEYLKVASMDSNEQFSLENMHYMISQRISSDVPQLSHIVLHGPEKWQKQAYEELTNNFTAEKYHQFVHEVISLHAYSIKKYHGSNETEPLDVYLRKHFHCYGQVLYDIAANLNLKKIILDPGFDAQLIKDSFMQLAVERGCGQACYEQAIHQFNKGEYQDAYRKFKIATLDENWNDPAKKEEAHIKAKEAEKMLRNDQRINPLRMVDASDQSPGNERFYAEITEFLSNQVPELPKTPPVASDSLPLTGDKMDIDGLEPISDDEEGALEDQVAPFAQSYIDPKGVTKKKEMNKRPYSVAFESGANLTLFAPEPAEDYDRTPVTSPQFRRQQDLIKRKKGNDRPAEQSQVTNESMQIS